MKISARKLSIYCFWFCILIDLHFFYLFAYPSFLITLLHNRIMTGSLALFMFILICIGCSQIKTSQMKFLRRYCIYIIIVFLVIFIYTLIKYPAQELKTTYLSSNNILVMLWAMPLVLFMKDIDGFHRFARKLNWILLIWLSLIMIQGILYNVAGVMILDFKEYFVGDISTRNNQIRIGIGAVANAVILYDFDVWFTKKIKKTGLPFIVFCIGMFDVVFIQQTRMYIIALAAGISVTLLVGSKGKKAKIRNILILFSIVGVLYFSNAVSDMIASFDVNSELGGSTENRLREFYYYLNYFCNHPLVGMGGLSDSVKGTFSSIVHGPLGWFYLDDIGYIGTLANGGILLSLIYVIFFVHSIKIIKVLKRKNKIFQYSYFIAILIFIFIADFSLTFFLSQKVSLILPIMVALGELIYIEQE